MASIYLRLLGFLILWWITLISTGNPRWGSKSPSTHQCVTNVFPLVLGCLWEISPRGLTLPHGSQAPLEKNPSLLLASPDGPEAGVKQCWRN